LQLNTLWCIEYRDIMFECWETWDPKNVENKKKEYLKASNAADIDKVIPKICFNMLKLSIERHKTQRALFTEFFVTDKIA